MSNKKVVSSCNLIVLFLCTHYYSHSYTASNQIFKDFKDAEQEEWNFDDESQSKDDTTCNSNNHCQLFSFELRHVQELFSVLLITSQKLPMLNNSSQTSTQHRTMTRSPIVHEATSKPTLNNEIILHRSARQLEHLPESLSEAGKIDEVTETTTPFTLRASPPPPPTVAPTLNHCDQYTNYVRNLAWSVYRPLWRDRFGIPQWYQDEILAPLDPLDILYMAMNMTNGVDRACFKSYQQQYCTILTKMFRPILLSNYYSSIYGDYLTSFESTQSFILANLELMRYPHTKMKPSAAYLYFYSPFFLAIIAVHFLGLRVMLRRNSGAAYVAHLMLLLTAPFIYFYTVAASTAPFSIHFASKLCNRTMTGFGALTPFVFAYDLPYRWLESALTYNKLLVFLIVAERYLALMHPRKHAKYLTRRRMVRAVGLGLVANALFSTLHYVTSAYYSTGGEVVSRPVAAFCGFVLTLTEFVMVFLPLVLLKLVRRKVAELTLNVKPRAQQNDGGASGKTVVAPPRKHILGEQNIALIQTKNGNGIDVTLTTSTIQQQHLMPSKLPTVGDRNDLNVSLAHKLNVPLMHESSSSPNFGALVTDQWQPEAQHTTGGRQMSLKREDRAKSLEQLLTIQPPPIANEKPADVDQMEHMLVQAIAKERRKKLTPLDDVLKNIKKRHIGPLEQQAAKPECEKVPLPIWYQRPKTPAMYGRHNPLGEPFDDLEKEHANQTVDSLYYGQYKTRNTVKATLTTSKNESFQVTLSTENDGTFVQAPSITTTASMFPTTLALPQNDPETPPPNTVQQTTYNNNYNDLNPYTSGNQASLVAASPLLQQRDAGSGAGPESDMGSGGPNPEPVPVADSADTPKTAIAWNNADDEDDEEDLLLVPCQLLLGVIVSNVFLELVHLIGRTHEIAVTLSAASKGELMENVGGWAVIYGFLGYYVQPIAVNLTFVAHVCFSRVFRRHVIKLLRLGRFFERQATWISMAKTEAPRELTNSGPQQTQLPKLAEIAAGKNWQSSD